jgi:hypothetical protein
MTTTEQIATWQGAYEQRAPATNPNALACRQRRERLRDAGLCIFCALRPARSLCAACRREQSEQARERYRMAVEREGRRVRPYRRRRRAESEGT